MDKFDTRLWGRWALTFIGFPLAGLAAKGVTGRIDSASAAVVGGLAAGAVLGGVRSFALRVSRERRLAWAGATAVGMAAGLAAGASAVGFETDAASLVVMGALTGAGIGIAQALVLPGSRMRRLIWSLVTPALWALGWLITAQVISDVDAQYANFGASGAIVCAVLGGLVLAVGATPQRTNTPAASTMRVVA
jgi:hypothetical protein